MLALLLFSSCGNESGGSSQTSVSTSSRASSGSLDSRFSGNYSYDKKTGRVQSSERSNYENRSAHAGGRDFRGDAYNTQGYNAKRWSGSKDYKKQSYQGNTDASRYKTSPHFVQQQARAQGQRAHSDGQSYRSQGQYQTGTSHLNNTQRLSNNPSAYAESRSDSVQQDLHVTDYRNTGGLNVQQTNSLLGR